MGFLSSIRRDMQGGTDAYQDLVSQRGTWVDNYLNSQGIYQQPVDMGSYDSEGGGNSGMGADIDYLTAQKKAQAAWLDTLDPDARQKALSEFSLHSGDMDAINKYGSLATKGLLGVIAGGAALTGSGLLGAAAPAASSGVTAGEIAAAAGMPELGLAAQTGLGGAAGTAAAGTAGGGGLMGSLGSLGSIGSAASSALDWAKKNPGLVSLLGGTLAAAGGGSGGTTATKKTYAPQPGLSFGTLKQSPQAMGGLLQGQPTQGLLNSGLSRFGATGGRYTPGQYQPTMFTWGQ